MAEVAYKETMREENSEYMDLMEYLEGVEDISSLGLNVEQTEQLRGENELLESRSMETMITYFTILEDELITEKQKVLRLEKVNKEIERDRHEIEELNKDLMKQKHKLETENQQLRQRLWRVKDLFSKTTDELCQLRRQNRMLHEILQMNKNPSVDDKREDSSQTLPRREKLERNASQYISQRRSNLDDKNLNSSTSEPNIQHFSSQSSHHNDDVCCKAQNSLLRDFITLKQAQQKNNNVGDTNATLLEGKSKQHKHEVEESSAKEELVQANDTESIGYGTEEFCADEIPIMPAPLPKDLLIFFDDTQTDGNSEHPKDKDIKKLEERNTRLTKVLQKLEMHCHHDRLNKRYQPRRQNSDGQFFTEMSRKTRKVYPGCNAKEEALLKAVKAGSVTRVRQVISEGADVNLTLLGNWTPLHIAAALGFVYICEELLDAGALKHAKDRWGDTPLHWAAANGCSEVAGLLVHHGDDVFKCGRGNKTPREKALAAGHNDLADWFAKKEQEQRKSTDKT